jgi:ABC-2 type transport system permease protein
VSAGLFGSVAVLGRRNIRQAASGRSIAVMFVYPLLFFIASMTVFRKLMQARGIDYAEFLPPAIVVQAVLFVAMSAAYMVADDKRSGLLDRFRTLPVNAAAVPLSRLAVDALRAVVAALVIVAAASLLGFRFHAGPLAALGFFALAGAVTVTFAAGCAALAMRASDPENVYSMLTMVYLIVITISTAFVPVRAFKGWLQPIVGASPVTQVVDALRALSAGPATLSAIWPALAWTAGLAVLFGWAAARAFRRAA